MPQADRLLSGSARSGRWTRRGAPKANRLRSIVAALLVAVIVDPDPGALAAADVDAFFQTTRQRLVEIARTPEAGRGSSCGALVRDAFEPSALAAAVATAGHWSVMGPDLRARLTAAVVERLRTECVSLVDRADPARARIGRTRETGDGTRLTVVMPDAEGNDRVVVWSLVPGGRYGWIATDLAVDGRSASTTYRQDFENATASRPTIVAAIDYFVAMGRR